LNFENCLLIPYEAWFHALCNLYTYMLMKMETRGQCERAICRHLAKTAA